MLPETIADFKKGKQDAFRKIFDEHFYALCSFGAKYVTDLTVAEDFVRESFLTLWEQREQFEHPKALKAYLYTSVRNKCLNHLKHSLVKRKHEEHLIQELEYDQFFENHIIEEEVFSKLISEIQSLPASARQIMLLALNGMSNPQIAEELGISLNTVKTQKKIAYGRLKSSVGQIIPAILLSL